MAYHAMGKTKQNKTKTNSDTPSIGEYEREWHVFFSNVKGRHSYLKVTPSRSVKSQRIQELLAACF